MSTFAYFLVGIIVSAIIPASLVQLSIRTVLLRVLVQVDKDIRHPFLLEQPSVQAAISSWHTDFELQEIFRKGEYGPSPVVVLPPAQNVSRV